MQKLFRTLDEQLNILKQKGLEIDDDEYVKEVLLRENYFFVTGYRHLFLDKNDERKYKKGANFREMYSLFEFDRQLRNIIFKYILVIENNIKSIFSYELSKNYGIREEQYLNISNFNTSKDKFRQTNDLLRKIKRQIRINGGQHSATTHYIYNYGYIPLWIVVKVLSFGLVCELYSVLKKEDQDKIAEIFNLEVGELLSYLPLLANYRNLCAHENILYDHKTASKVEDTIYHSRLNIQKDTEGEYIYGKNDLFSLIIILKRLLREENFRLLIKEIDYEKDYLSGKLNSIQIDDVLEKMGFPPNYKELIDL